MRPRFATVLLTLAGCNQVFGLDPVGRADGGPPPIDGPPRRVDEVVAGAHHTCVRTGAEVRCWGRGTEGQLGHGDPETIGDDEVPATRGPVQLMTNAIALAAGGDHTCALVEGAAVMCWGEGGQGQLGYGDTTNVGDGEAPSTAGVVSLGAAASRLVAGASHTCALIGGGQVLCWGAGARGQLGTKSTANVGDVDVPSVHATVMPASVPLELAAGGDHTCAVVASGRPLCWGANDHGQLGIGSTATVGDDEPPTVEALVPTTVAVVAGDEHTCALDASGDVRCWGAGADGRLGYRATTDLGATGTLAGLAPVQVGAQVTQLAAGARHTCALLATKTVRCWGANDRGQLGYGNTAPIGDDELPMAAGDVPLPGLATAITAGGDHTCALLEDATVRCWGANTDGELGTGDPDDRGVTGTLADLPPVAL